jgi:hypothetical protein
MDTEEEQEHDGDGDEEGDSPEEFGDDLTREAEEAQEALELHSFKGQTAVGPTTHREWSLDDFDTAGRAATKLQSEDEDLGMEILEGHQDEDPLLMYDSRFRYLTT